MASKKSMKDKEMASDLKRRGVTRTTGTCPMGCGRSIPVGGPALLSHLNFCTGPKKGV